jgi:hypothetical protein
MLHEKGLENDTKEIKAIIQKKKKKKKKKLKKLTAGLGVHPCNPQIPVLGGRMRI